MIVVSNAGPLIALARIRRLEILADLYGEVSIPRGVWREIVDAGDESRPGTRVFVSAKWLHKAAIKDTLAAEVLGERLDIGESEAIVLAIESRAAVLLMDEERGRRAAVARGLNVAGTLATLVLAKQKKLVATVAPLLDELAGSGFHMSTRLYRTVLEMAGERVPGMPGG